MVSDEYPAPRHQLDIRVKLTYLVPHAVVSDEYPAPRHQGLVDVPEQALLVLDMQDRVPADKL